MIFFSFLMIASCGKEEETVAPSNLIAKDDFKTIMVEMHLAEGIISQTVITDSLNLLTLHTYNDVLKKHNTTKEIFQESMNYYSRNNDEFILIMEDVVDSLNVLNLSLMPN